MIDLPIPLLVSGALAVVLSVAAFLGPTRGES